jgi:hypothetical protein
VWHRDSTRTVIRPNAKQAPYHTPVAPRAILASPRHVVSATHGAAQLHACTKNQLDGFYCQVAFVSVVFLSAMAEGGAPDPIVALKVERKMKELNEVQLFFQYQFSPDVMTFAGNGGQERGH